MRPPTRRQALRIALGVGAVAAVGGRFAYDASGRRVVAVVPGRIYRGAWQSPGALARLIRRERIRTVVTLTAINPEDPKYRAQKPVVDASGVDWIVIPMRGSTATLDELRRAADLVADPSRQPVFFHCVGGHHRSNLVQMAYRIRYEGWTVERAWSEVARLAWTRPDDPADRRDRTRIDEFTRAYALDVEARR
ncbi:MAG: tyrosine protein phosphatase [Isosphaeraceae bacterium]